MTYQADCTLPTELLEQITEGGFEALPAAIRLLLNTAMLLERQVAGIVFAGGQYAEADASHDHYGRLLTLRLPVVLVTGYGATAQPPSGEEALHGGRAAARAQGAARCSDRAAPVRC